MAGYVKQSYSTCVRAGLGIASIFCLTSATGIPGIHAQSLSYSESPAQSGSSSSTASRAASMEKRIDVDFKDAPFTMVIDSLSQKLGVRINYSSGVVSRAPRVTLRAMGVKGTAIVERILEGTNLELIEVEGRLVLSEKAKTDSTAKVTRGTFVGTVLDSVTRSPLAGVTVSVQGTRISGLTSESGTFTLRDVPSGKQAISIRMVGYKTKTLQVDIETQGQTRVDVSISASSALLNEIVTTASGMKRKLEVGNDVTVISVDSIMRNMPVATLPELLSTRVPGIDVIPASGEPGAPSRLRIRGVRSLNTSNDPVIILDGVRMYGDQLSRSNLFPGSTQRNSDVGVGFAASPLDQIDLGMLETVEVLKGPSAVALYGTDAANGVIVITTKKGKSGPTTWSLNGHWGQEKLPGKWPLNYRMYGTRISNAQGAATGVECVVGGFSGGNEWITSKCIGDSVVTYQILNDPFTTVFGTGTSRRYAAEVRGGMQGLTYSVSGSISNTLGILKMPDMDVAVIKREGNQVPGWQRRPQGQENQSISANMTGDVGRIGNISFTSILSRNEVRNTPLRNAMTVSPYLDQSPDSLVGTGLFRFMPAFRNRITTNTQRITNAAQGVLTPKNWLNLTLTAGNDLMSRKDKSVLNRGDCSGCWGLESTGIYDVGFGSVSVYTLNGRATTPIPISRFLSVRLTAGTNYSRTTSEDLASRASGLVAGATSGNTALVQSFMNSRDDRSVAGLFSEAVFNVFDKFYLPISVRTDAGSGLGAGVRPTFPRLAFSYIVSDIDAFRNIPVLGKVDMLRLRTAYGQSGTQPSVAAKLRTYATSNATVNNAQALVLNLNGIGNTVLRPERSTEWEGGFDTDFWDSRVTLGVTYFRQRTLDALINLPVPISVVSTPSGTPITQQRNIGTVDNSGLELTLNSTLVQRREISWNFNGSFSSTKNRLVKLGIKNADTLVGGGMVRFAVGYPLFGRWERSVAGYADLNGDGIIQGTEIRFGDSSSYVGAPYPNFETSFHNSFVLYGRVTLNFVMQYQDGLTQEARTEVFNTRLNWDPTLTDIARVRMMTTQMQTVSTLRWSSASIGYIAPRSLTSRLVGNRTVTFGLQGTNLWLKTNYRGIDPSINNLMSEVVQDIGGMPTPRTWNLSIVIN